MRIDDDVISVWHMLIGHVEPELAKEAFTRYMQVNIFEPNAAGILYQVEVIRASRNQTMSVGEAWASVLWCAQSYGVPGEERAKMILSEFPGVWEAAAALPYRELCLADTSRNGYFERSFERNYGDHTKRTQEELKTITAVEAKEILAKLNVKPKEIN